MDKEITILYILNSALKHRAEIKKRFPNAREAFYDPKKKIVYGDIKGHVILVDNNVASGSTLFKTLQLLKGYRITIASNFVAKKSFHVNIPIINLEFVTPKTSRLIFFCGPAGSGKTAFAKALAERLELPYIKWGRFISENFIIGDYGEKLSDPYINDFIAPISLYQQHFRIFEKEDKDIIIDGMKTLQQIITISYISRRPPIVFYFSLPKTIRNKIITVRAMQDDKYAEKRELFFKHGLDEIKYHDKTIIVHPTNWSKNSTYAQALRFFFGITPPLLSKNIVNLWFNKRFILWNYYKAVIKAPPQIHKVSFATEHTKYIDRLEQKFNIKLNRIQKEIIKLTATAFRIIDDILDEDTVRDGKPAYWTVVGPFTAITNAIIGTITARALADITSLKSQFDDMFTKIIHGVDFELRCEENKIQKISLEQWIYAAQKETAYRVFLAHFINKPEIAPQMYLWGLIAQAKDDILGNNKFGRKGHEIILNRPLFQNTVETQNIDKEELLKTLESLKKESPETIAEAKKMFIDAFS